MFHFHGIGLEAHVRVSLTQTFSKKKRESNLPGQVLALILEEEAEMRQASLLVDGVEEEVVLALVLVLALALVRVQARVQALVPVRVQEQMAQVQARAQAQAQE